METIEIWRGQLPENVTLQNFNEETVEACRQLEDPDVKKKVAQVIAEKYDNVITPESLVEFINAHPFAISKETQRPGYDAIGAAIVVIVAMRPVLIEAGKGLVEVTVLAAKEGIKLGSKMISDIWSEVLLEMIKERYGKGLKQLPKD